MRFLCCLLVFLAMPVTAWAQASVQNPTTVVFTPSADHSALTSEGLPVVVRYDLQFFRVADLAVPVRTVDLGKPGIGSDGTIAVVFSTLTPYPLPDGNYVARVIAVGQKGTGASDPSNEFTFGSSVDPALPVPTNVVIRGV